MTFAKFTIHQNGSDESYFVVFSSYFHCLFEIVICLTIECYVIIDDDLTKLSI